MNILKRLFGGEQRSMTTRDVDGWQNLLGAKTRSGVQVDTAAALSIPAALSAVRLLSEAVASLPLIVYERAEGRIRAVTHPLYSLLHEQPNHRHSPFQLKEMMMLSLLVDGNSYAFIQRDAVGQPVALWPVQASRVTVRQDDNGNVTYEINTSSGQVVYRPDEILHIAGLSFDGLTGRSPISLARESLGSAVAELQHGSSFFKNSSIPSGVITHPGQLSEQGQELLKSSWQSAYGGTVASGKTAILEEGMKFEPIKFNNKDSQWLESRAFSVKEIARIFRVPPHLLGDLEKASYASIEQQNLDFLTYSLRPWLCRIEEAVNLQLLYEHERQQYFAEFLTADLLRADTKNRFESYQTALQSGWLSINEVRQRENMPTVPGGDKLFIELNREPLDERSKLEIRSQERDTELATVKRKLTAFFEELLKKEQEALLELIENVTDVAMLEAVITNWYTENLDSLAADVHKEFKPLIRSLNENAASVVDAPAWTRADLDSYCTEYSRSFAEKHAAISVLTLCAAIIPEQAQQSIKQHLEGQRETRPGKMSESEASKITNSTRKKTWKDAGVTKLVWQVEPDACVLCSALAGKVVGIDAPFIAAGEELQCGEEMITHQRATFAPPLHVGCQCWIAPE